MLGLCCCSSFLWLQWAGAPLGVRGLLIAVASPVEHGLQGRGLPSLRHLGSVAVAPGIESTGFVIVVHRSSCCIVCGNVPGQGENPRLPHWWFFTTEPLEKLKYFFGSIICLHFCWDSNDSILDPLILFHRLLTFFFPMVSLFHFYFKLFLLPSFQVY